MCELPATLARVLDCFAPVFSRRIWTRAQVLLLGALLANGARTVTAALRAMGQTRSRAFPTLPPCAQLRQVVDRSVGAPAAGPAADALSCCSLPIPGRPGCGRCRS
jgi:hypothetical protein